MKRVSNNFIALLMIFLMLSSLIGTTLISYMVDKRASVFGEVPIQQTGTVGVTVAGNETTTTTGGAGGGGGGGGGGAAETHIVDFRIKEIYSYFIDKGDTVIVIFSDTDKYILKVEAHRLKETVTFNIDGTKFEVKSDEVTSIDFDRDNLVDMTIKFDSDGKIVFSLFHKPKTPEIVRPIISSQKISEEEEKEQPVIPKVKSSYIIILVIIIVIIIGILVYQHYRLRNVETSQKKKLTKLAKEYSSKVKSDVEAKVTREKLERQLQILEKSYNSGFITRDSYIKGKKKIKDSMNKQ